MGQSNVREAKTQLSKLIQQARAGEEVIIATAGKPVVRLVPIGQQQPPVQRQLGGWTGKFWMAEEVDQCP